LNEGHALIMALGHACEAQTSEVTTEKYSYTLLAGVFELCTGQVFFFFGSAAHIC
jgi:hypothetical protein